ncbi:LOW QUALITY PROTEIN: hypothetical protein MAR_002830 [Mya arenaria]|uniref:DDE-1 domain-containing protein n=1 Tax=Mya arenaria TaxID=6604 RepID=A0ABY7G7G9_MYAAR|nr:LOW QUALITY PROTEIN: hypothetical protein MAR_002830 [Mya arenaria]
MSVYKAAILYGLPESMLRDRTLGLQPVTNEHENLPSLGQLPTFTANEERQLVEHLSYMASIGYGHTRSELLNLATDWAITLSTGRSRRRNPDVTLAKPQKLSVLRAKCTSEETINKYFAELEKVMKKHDLDNHPELIWNIDETGLMMEHNPRHVVCVKGMTPQAITSSRVKTVTIIACGSAAGIRLPPYYDHSVMILFDGHKSHINLTLSAWGEANNVVFFVLPQHTSHPLDVGCFGPLKNIYHSECQSYMRRNPGMQINRYNIAEISSKAYNKGVCAENLISAFRKTGVFPRRRYSITPAKTAPSAIYTIDHTGDHVHSIVNSQDVQPESFLDRKQKNTESSGDNQNARKRKPTIMGDITSPSKKELMMPNENVKKPKKTVKEKKTKNAHLSPVPGPSAYCKILASSDTEKEDLCCVCRKFSPEPMNVAFTIELVNWGECDKCGHWTHLKYCSQVKVVRRHDEFLCPCCE